MQLVFAQIQPDDPRLMLGLFIAASTVVGLLIWWMRRADLAHQAAAGTIEHAEQTPPPRQARPQPPAPITAAYIAPAPQASYPPPQPVTPAPVGPRMLSFDETMRALTASLHLLIVGESDAGKSTSAQAVLVTRIKMGDRIMILDPHAEPTAWGGLPAVGAGRNYPAISHAMATLLAEMTSRYQRRAAGDTGYQPISIFIDEWPGIQTHCKQAGAFITEMAQEGRKVGLRLVVLTQSDRVESLGIAGKGDVRGNFAMLLLGNKATEALPATNAARRPAAIKQGTRMMGADVSGMLAYERVTIDPAYTVSLSSLTPPAPVEPRPTPVTADNPLLTALVAGSPLPFEDEAPMTRPQNQGTTNGNQAGNHPLAPVGTTTSEGREPDQEPGNPTNVERAAIEKWLTDGLSANTIAAELGGKRAVRLAQIRAIKEAMQSTPEQAPTTNEECSNADAAAL